MKRATNNCPAGERKLVTYNEIRERYTIGANKARELAKAAGAVVTIGTMQRIDIAKMDAYIDSLGA